MSPSEQFFFWKASLNQDLRIVMYWYGIGCGSLVSDFKLTAKLSPARQSGSLWVGLVTF